MHTYVHKNTNSVSEKEAFSGYCQSHPTQSVLFGSLLSFLLCLQMCSHSNIQITSKPVGLNLVVRKKESSQSAILIKLEVCKTAEGELEVCKTAEGEDSPSSEIFIKYEVHKTIEEEDSSQSGILINYHACNLQDNLGRRKPTGVIYLSRIIIARQLICLRFQKKLSSQQHNRPYTTTYLQIHNRLMN